MVPKAAPNRRKFKAYLNDRERLTKKALSAIQKIGPAAVLETCRVLADQINTDLCGKRPEHFSDILWLAEFQVCLERAALVLKKDASLGTIGAPRVVGLQPFPECILETNARFVASCGGRKGILERCINHSEHACNEHQASAVRFLLLPAHSLAPTLPASRSGSRVAENFTLLRWHSTKRIA